MDVVIYKGRYFYMGKIYELNDFIIEWKELNKKKCCWNFRRNKVFSCDNLVDERIK